MRLYFILLFGILLTTICAFYVTHRWNRCQPIKGSVDQNCNGTRYRWVDFFNETDYSRINRTTEWEYCLITPHVVDGGYTDWTSWTDCSKDCHGTATKQRYCNNPTPCNGGNDCTDLGADMLVKDCGPQDGEWNSWGSWSACELPDGSLYYGTGTYTRKRYCNYTVPLCGGETCAGPDTDTGNCRNVPACLTSNILDEKFLEPESPMVIYTSANVEFYPLTQSECPGLVLYNYWNFYYMNSSSENDTLVKGPVFNLKFKIQSGEYEVGLYKLYVKIGYPQNLHNWMEESMYIQILHAPPHAFIRGGSGRTVGHGTFEMDAQSVSYSLSREPGDATGLTFMWKCMNFITSSIYKLLQLNIEPTSAFNYTTEEQEKWYHTGFTMIVENEVPWIEVSTLYDRYQYYKGAGSTCLRADEMFAKVYSSTNTSLTDFELVPLTDFYNITYLSDMSDGANLRRKINDIYPHPSYNTRIQNELITFLDTCYESSSLLQDTEDFYTLLSKSQLTLESLHILQDFPSITNVTSRTFFDDLNAWVDTAVDSLVLAEQMLSFLTTFRRYTKLINDGMDLTRVIGLDMYLHLAIDRSNTCILDFLDAMMGNMVAINSNDWYGMKQKDKYYNDWIQNELHKVTECPDFEGVSTGKANLTITESEVQQGMGYVVIVQVSYEGSVAYFTQYAQAVTGQPLLIDIDCRLNCMKKTAITATMSLKSSCPHCTENQLRGAQFLWNVRNFDTTTRISSNNSNWQNWLLTDVYSRKFVMMPNVLTENSGYLIEAYLELSNGERFLSIWSVTTNMLPYGGECSVKAYTPDTYRVIVEGWKDEGFRSIKNPALDWKEQINYRIVQKLGGEERLLYYGAEEENFITLLPGLESDDYKTSIAVQIFDIFVDFNECVLSPGKKMPTYNNFDPASVSAYLISAAEDIDYYLQSGNVKQVAMNSEVAGSSVHDLTRPSTLRDIDPYNYVHIGAETLADGSVTNITFDDLWNQLENPDTGDNDSNNEIISHLKKLYQQDSMKETNEMIIKSRKKDSSGNRKRMYTKDEDRTLTNFIEMLNSSVEDADGTSTVNIKQLINSIGTNIANKQFVSNKSVIVALEATEKLQDMLHTLADNETYPKYEDYYDISEGMLKVLNNVLEGLLPESWADTPSVTDIDSIMDLLDDRSSVLPDNVSYSLTKLERAFIVSEIASRNKMETQLKNDIVQEQVPKLLRGISSLSSILEMLNYRRQLKMEIKNGNITTSQDKTYAYELVSKGVEQGDVNLGFNYSVTSSLDEQNIKVTSFTNNPFSWHDGSRFITSQTVNVKVEDNDLVNSPVMVSNVKIKNNLKSSTTTSVQVAVPIDISEAFSNSFVYKMYWNNPEDSLLFFIENVEPYIMHKIYVSQRQKPSESNYDWKTEVDSSESANGKITVAVNKKICSSPCLVYVGVHLSSSGVQMSQVSIGNATLGLGRRRRRSTRRTVSQQTELIEYSVAGITTGCRVWNKGTESWDKTSCKVSSLSTIQDTICECTDPPGEDFATTFYVPPNTIDFSTVFDKFDLKNNAAVFATVISLLLLFSLINIWAYRQDKLDPKRWALSYLQDNSPYDEHLYLLTVYTGLYRNSGTTSNVQIHIIDEKMKKCSTRTRQLEDGEKKGFGQGSIRRFIMTTPFAITDPTVLKVWHDNSGKGNSASWYLHKIIFQDIKDGKRFTFICNRWLSIDREDDDIECTLLVSNPDDVESFSNSFSTNSRENMTDSYLWLSVALRPKEDNFTRVQRLACCLALLFLTMITSAMFYEQETGNKISIGPFSFTIAGIYISFVSALISAPPVLFITYIFRNSTSKSHNKSPEAESKKQSLPYQTIFLAWGLIVVTIALSGFFLILYSMEWGKTRSEEWLLSFFFSFLETTILIDPLKVIVISVVLSLICKQKSSQKSKNIDYKKIMNEARRRSLSSGCSSLRGARDDAVKGSSPLEQEEVNQLRSSRKEVLKTKRIIAEIVLYLIFLTIVYVISFNNRDPRWFYFKNHIEQHLIEKPNSVSIDTRVMFKQIGCADQLYTFISGTLLPFLFPLQSVSRAVLDSYERQFVMDILNFRVGPVRLRQLRIKEESCSASRYNFTNSIFPDYSLLKNDDQDYCIGWTSLPCPEWESVQQISSPAWKSTSASDVWGIPIWGQHSTYAGGGYLADMSINLQISNRMLENLKQNKWIDRKTRAVFIEFTLYNTDDNVFLYTTLLTEFPETGGTIQTATFKPFRPYQHVGGIGIFVFICEILTIIGMVTVAIKKIVYLRRHRLAAFKNVWNVLDLIIVSFFFICIVTYIGRSAMISYAMNKFKKSKLKFVNFQHIVVWDDLFNTFLAGIVFCITFRIMRVLQFSERINHMGYIFSYVSRDICGCLLMFFFVYIAFVMSGYLIFGRQLDTYRNIFVSATTLTNAIVGKNTINDLFIASPVLGRLYYFCFVFFLLWVVMTMLNAALNVGITDANTSFVHTASAVTLQKHLWNMVKDAIRTIVPVKTDPKQEVKNKTVLKTNQLFTKQKSQVGPLDKIA